MKKKQKTGSDAADLPRFKESSEEKPEAQDDIFQLSESMVFQDEQDHHFIEDEVDATFNLFDATTVRDDPTQDTPITPTNRTFEKHVTMVPGGDLDAVTALEPASPKPSADNTIDDRLEDPDSITAQNTQSASIREEAPLMLNETDQPSESEKASPSSDDKKEVQAPHKTASSMDASEGKNKDIPEMSSPKRVPTNEDPTGSIEDDGVIDLSAPTILMEAPIEPFESVLEDPSLEPAERDEDENSILDLDAGAFIKAESILKTDSPDDIESDDKEDDVLDLGAAAVVMDEPDSPDINVETKENDEVVDLNAPTIMMPASEIETRLSDQADSLEKEEDILDLSADSLLKEESVPETGSFDRVEEDDILELSAAAVVTDEPDPPDVNGETEENDEIVDLNAPTIMMSASEIETTLSDQANAFEKESDILDLSADSLLKEDSVLGTDSSDEAESSEENDIPFDLTPDTVLKEESDMIEEDDILDLSAAEVAVDEPDTMHQTEADEDAVDLNAATIILPPSGLETEAPDIHDSEFEEDSVLDLGAVDAKVVSDMPSSPEPAIQPEEAPPFEETLVLSSDSETAPQKDMDEDESSQNGEEASALPSSDSTDDMEFKLPDDFPMPIFDEFPEPDNEEKDPQADNGLSMTGILDTIEMPDRGDAADDNEIDALIDMSILDADADMFSAKKNSHEDIPAPSPLSDEADEKGSEELAENEEKTPHETKEGINTDSPEDDQSAIDAAPAENAEESEKRLSDLPRAKPSTLKTERAAPVKNGGIPIIEILPEGGEMDLPHAKTCHSSFTRNQIEKALERVIEKIFAEKIEGILQDAVEKAVAQEVKRLTNLMMIDDVEDI